jgi:hypothetical protein
MNEQELKNLIVAKDLEIYKLRTELALAQKQVKELTSYLDQVTTPVKDKVTPEPVQNEKKSNLKGTKYKYLTEEEIVKRFKIDGISSSVPYYWYHSRGIIIPDWARKACSKYIAERKAARTSTKKMNLSPADYIEHLAEEALNTSREIADLVK